MDGIVLLAKEPGLTSFSSLNVVKKALQTSKVGHTGTLDSFAQGLLVVCTGRLTRLSGKITDFNKTYKAVLEFGRETDTLECTGKVIKEAPLPKKDQVLKIIPQFIGKQLQLPPLFSALHVSGQRASDLARQGKEVKLEARPVEVFDAKILEMDTDSNDCVKACLIEFSVSKGTYIRSLARDIGQKLNSAAHLKALFRSKVGNFNIEDACGFENLCDFNIKNACNPLEKENKLSDEELKNKIRQNIKPLTKSLAEECGFINIDLTDDEALASFKNGQAIKNKMFIQDLFKLPCQSQISVFYKDDFYGLLNKDENGKIRYGFVIN